MQKEIAGHAKARLWGEFRFSVIGGLLAAPPEKGDLKACLLELAQKNWRHPITGEPHRFSFGTIEEWYYAARSRPDDPVSALWSRRRRDRGHGRQISDAFKKEIIAQYECYPDWSIQLHADNLRVLASMKPEIGPSPSYATIRRFMRQLGLKKQKKVRRKPRPGLELAEAHLEKKEVRSFEMEHVGSLWHLDFHHGSRKIQDESGKWVQALCLAIHDDHSRLACHVQWYLEESARCLVHGLSQAIMKRGKPWTLMTDNGGAMKAEEFTEGLARIGVLLNTTLPYSPYQNGKTERFWGVLEGRLMAMLKGSELSLRTLNEATHAWVEGEYNREINREIGQTPYERFSQSPNISRPSPSWEELKMAFRMDITRKQRRSDGSITVDGVRFELPNLYRRLQSVRLRYARWDLSLMHSLDDDHQVIARIYPLDKSMNSSRQRRSIQDGGELGTKSHEKKELPPLLKKLMADFAETGLPAAYIPDEINDEL